MGFGWSGIGAFLRGDDVAGATADTLGGDAKVFGRKPKVAPFVPVDLSNEIGKTTKANLDNADSISAMLDKLIPGFSDLVKTGLDTSGQLLRGEIPQDVQDQIMRDDALQSMLGGYGGTGMARNLTARDFGKTSLDLVNQGQNSAQMWTKLAETSYDPFIIKTMEQAGTTAANNAGSQEQQQRQFNVNAAPDPAAAAKFAIDSAIGMKMMDWGLGVAGGFMGGGSSNSSLPNYTGAGQAGTAAGNDWLLGTNQNGSVFQYNPSTGTYQNIPKATGVWGG